MDAALARRALDLTACAADHRERRLAIGMRTQLMECRTFKARIGEQGRPGELVRLYRLAHLSHWVWVIEFHDKRRSDAGKPCVVAEVIMDSTSHDDLPFVHLLATRELAMDVAEMRKVGAQDSSVAIRRHMRPWRSLSSLDGCVRTRP